MRRVIQTSRTTMTAQARKKCLRPAVFFDRDGTLIEDAGYLSDPAGVRLLAGVGPALRRLSEAGFALVVVSNQSGVGRGLLTEQQMTAVSGRMRLLLEAEAVTLDGMYHCTIAPTVGDHVTIEHEDRKPGPGMLKRAARELRLDLLRSWMVGDKLSDALAGINAGCEGVILVESGHRLEAAARSSVPAGHVVADVSAACELILRTVRSGVDK